MKKSLIAAILCILILVAAASASAKQSTQKPARDEDISVTLISQQPDPAEPNGYVDLRFKFDNNGSGEAANVEAEILPKYPFYLEEGAESIQSLGTIQAMQRGDVGVITKYRLRIDKNAVEGKNDIKIRYRINNGVWIQPKEFYVDIQTHDAILSVDSVSLANGTLRPGSSNELRIKVSNRADSILKDIQVKISLSGLPFAPIGSTDEMSLYQIPPMTSDEIVFNILAKPDAKADVYQVPLQVAYSDELGKKYIKNSTIGITVGSKPELSVVLDKSEIYEKGTSGEIIIKVVNKGITGIKFTTMKLSQSQDYNILSSDEVYLGNIDSDDFQTASFRIFANKNAKNDIAIPIALEYKDANNNNYRDSINLNLKTYSSGDAKRFGLKTGNGLVGNIIILLIVAVGLFYYLRHRKKKKKD